MSDMDDPLLESGIAFNESFVGDDIQPDVDVDLLAEAFFDGSNNIDPVPGEFDNNDPNPISAANGAVSNSININNNPTTGQVPYSSTIANGATPQTGGFPVQQSLQQPQQQPLAQVVTPPSAAPAPQFSAGISHSVVPQAEPLFKNKQHHEQMLKAAQAQLQASQPPAQPQIQQPVQPQVQPQVQPLPQPLLPTSSATATATPNPAAASSQFVSIAPAMPVNGPMTVAADPSQQAFIFTTLNENGEQVSAAVPNPFLAMAAASASNPAVFAEQQQFMEAAIAARTRGRKKQITPEQEEARRERNRELAKKTRERKKNYMDGLQDEVLELQRANAELKAMARLHMDEKDSSKLLEGCDAVDKVPETVWEACGTNPKELAEEDFDMVSSIQKSQTAFCITDPSFDDNPIVFVSPDFLALTGYKREQVVGRNCRFLQGAATCHDKVEQIRRALAEGEDVGVTLVNYKADGTPFWNRLFIAAVRDINDNVVNYMGVAVEVARPEPGDPEHDKKLH